MFPLQENEYIIKYVRKHWIWLFAETLKVLFVFIIPATIVILIDLYFVDSATLFFGYPVTKLLDLFVYVWAIFCWGFMADRFTKYALNFWVLTNKKVVESEHLMLFSRKLSTLELESVEDITVKFEGILETLLNFGSLTVQTAGTQREFLADDIKDPEGVKKIIFDSKQDIKEDDKNVTVKNTDEMQANMLADEIDSILSQKNKDEEDQSEGITIPHHFELPHDQKSVNTYDWANK